MAEKDIGTGHIRNVELVCIVCPSHSTLAVTPNTMQPRRSVLDFVRARFRRLIRNPVVVWFAGIIFAILMIVMLMILLLNIDVTGVDDLLADIPLDVTGVRDCFRRFWIPWLTVIDRNHWAYLSPRP